MQGRGVGGRALTAEAIFFFFMLPKRREGNGKIMHNSEMLLPRIVLEDYKISNKYRLITYIKSLEQSNQSLLLFSH